MNRIAIVLAFSLLMGSTAWAQQEPAEESAATEAAEVEDTEPAAEEIDESGLDEQDYEDVDDDFRPSEEISTDQSIAFPTDI